MDIVLIFNGLGNQMSQYAFYLAKKKRNRHTKFLQYPDWGTCQHNGYELDKIFGIKKQNGEKSILGRLYKWYGWSQVCDSRKRHWLRVIFEKIPLNRIDERRYDFDQERLDNAGKGIHFYYGGWHCPDYLKDVEQEVRNAYKFDESQLNKEGKEMLNSIESLESVSLHVRRGDFLTDGFGGICTVEYYKKAIAYVKERVSDPVFYVFSDDLEWARENIKEEKIRFVDIHKGKDSWKDMLLISHCKHNINANSTFSWWGAWLNNNPGKIVIVPPKFSQKPDSGAIYPKEWIRIES